MLILCFSTAHKHFISYTSSLFQRIGYWDSLIGNMIYKNKLKISLNLLHELVLSIN